MATPAYTLSVHKKITNIGKKKNTKNIAWTKSPIVINYLKQNVVNVAAVSVVVAAMQVGLIGSLPLTQLLFIY